MNLINFANTHGFEDISAKVAELAESTDKASLDILKNAFLKKPEDSYTRNGIAPLMGLALLQKGPDGVRGLIEALPNSDGATFPKEIISSIWNASNGKLAHNYTFSYMPPLPPLLKPLTEATIQAAKKAFIELILESRSNPDLFGNVLNFINEELHHAFFSEDDKRVPKEESIKVRSNFIISILEIFTHGSINISQHLIDEFEQLIHSNQKEETFQQFLSNHPVFIDPLASEIIPKQRMGIELITDFVTRRYDNRYILVEIEKPHDNIFTASGDFSAKFTHAFGQVLDFQQWVDANAEYARKHMPDISSPRGLLVMGLRKYISKENQQKLHRFTINSTHIDVLTFDDLLENAKNLLTGILRKK
ncbi:MAG: DUF4263 domain-containing protein [Geobacteraceae bacterium]|nr:DUF4263 domain-containing protein [Geobacteraceae bacterium]